MIQLLVLVIAYLLGAIPFGYLLVKWKTGADVRGAGSGNIGATNVMRTTGRVTGFATLLLDIAKGYAAVWIAGRLAHSLYGHSRPASSPHRTAASLAAEQRCEVSGLENVRRTDLVRPALAVSEHNLQHGRRPVSLD